LSEQTGAEPRGSIANRRHHNHRPPVDRPPKNSACPKPAPVLAVIVPASKR
jgi:hypothetical protein